jgi:anaerobic selenocysteine-containing dehydrogenase
MFPQAAAGQPNTVPPHGQGRGVRVGRWHSRVRGLPEVWGELPLSCLAEEIETPGEGQLRGLITIAGNPAVSAPNAPRVAAALAQLDFMVSIDFYVNETTRFADVVLPGPPPLQRSHYDLVLYQLAARNVANYSPPAVPADPDVLEEWETLLRLTAIAQGAGPDADVEELDRAVLLQMVEREVGAPDGPLSGRDADDIVAALDGRRGPLRLLDLMLRAGPYGDRFGERADGLSLAALERAPHGIDLGPLQPRIPEALRTPSGKIELAPEQIVADVPRLAAAMERRASGGMVLIGRRQLRSNNSWMHNLAPLVRGKDRCTAHVNPVDAQRAGLADGAVARISSRAGVVEIPVEVTEAVMPGVVSIPHGWGHDVDGVRMQVAAAHPGVNSNILSDDSLVDPLSGNAVLNGIPVEIARAD